MNRLEREVLEELEADYEFNEERAVAIVALVREAIEQEIADAIQEPVEVDLIEQMVNQLRGNVNSITNTVTATGALTNISAPTITATVDNLRQHTYISCSCGWALTVSLTLTDYYEVVKKDIDEHGKYAHGVDFNY